jgi:signal transduction histidine kinase
VRRSRSKAEEELDQTYEKLRAMAHRVVELQEEERRNIARELHDEIGQSLTGLKLLISQATRSLPSSSSEILKEAQSVVTELMQQVREMSLKLRPSMLDDLGLLPTLLWYFERYTAQTRIKISFEHSGLQRNFPADINTAVYRIIQEALTNVARYADVGEADVRVRANHNRISLLVQDRGAGFDAARLAAKASAGLSGMRERAQLLGGSVNIETSPGKGTRLLAELPLQTAGVASSTGP